jgi:hypothetical protein
VRASRGVIRERHIRIIPLRYPSSRELRERRVGRARVWRDWRDWRCGRSLHLCTSEVCIGVGGVDERILLRRKVDKEKVGTRDEVGYQYIAASG